MAKTSLIVITAEDHPELTLEEICHACHVTPDFIQEMMEHGAIEPKGFSLETWRFEASHLHRVRTAAHLHQDLEINSAGVALVLDMLDQMAEMQARLELLKKFI